jgi:hypothetical protein
MISENLHGYMYIRIVVLKNPCGILSILCAIEVP